MKQSVIIVINKWRTSEITTETLLTCTDGGECLRDSLGPEPLSFVSESITMKVTAKSTDDKDSRHSPGMQVLSAGVLLHTCLIGRNESERKSYEI